MSRYNSSRIIKLDRMVFVMPEFIHEFGYSGHHGSLMRTCPRDDDGDYDLRHWKKPIKNWQFEFHEIIEEYLFYPFRDWCSSEKRRGRSIRLLNESLLTFVWGLLCRFPFRDVVSYTIWNLRGYKPIQVFEEDEDGCWRQTYPAEAGQT